ncbi:Hsp20/alpha crystallin family protein [Corallococcus sp. H22C18031201]|uniref:Hsp20/alpha crystallin family protein n=1 Tax=Citreicoccus inhibens TaxID=2849499 RepID=UPI000E73C9FC|nr:Hsp20/alpha crystallin family protein [Citreicoccus inhibens]MBU8896282.1 Hsp20/alpha crystallin family protein [Citreicoccus inhibens]RJS17385.1 Hsp20/alpha crystallin family protein [Corallococcus sp. H22C18031201]
MQTYRHPFNAAVTLPLMRDFDLLFRELASPRSQDARELTPAADILEAEAGVTIRVDLPGHDAKSIQVKVENDVLTVRSERKAEPGESGVTVRRQERASGVYSRSFGLPDTVDSTRVEARYENGVLTLTLPRSEATKPRVVEVKVQG